MKYISKLIRRFFALAKNQSGFSLSGIIVAVTILSLATSVSATYLDDSLSAARDAQRMANIYQVQTALNFYYDDKLRYPISNSDEPTVQAWQEMKVALEQNQPQPYMPKVPDDPLNQGEYQFKYWSDGRVFKLVYETEDFKDDSPRVAWGL